MSSSDIKALRQGIRDIDAQILELTAKRMEICRKVGEYKEEKNLPVKDYKVEKLILEKTRLQAKNLGIYPDLAESIIKNLIKYSVIEQDQIKSQKRSKVEASDLMNVLVIGGHGNMGRWMSIFFDSLGHNVRILDEQSNQLSDFKCCDSLDDGLSWANIIVLATPMISTNDYLLSFATKNIEGIVLEISSLKSPILKGLELAKEKGIQVVSIHPMFGPNVDILSGRNIIVCEDKQRLQCVEKITEIFKQTSANIINLPLQQHDKYMNYILGSAHLINLLYANVLNAAHLSFSDLNKLSGTTFSDQIAVSKNVVSENQDLYYEIQSLNHETPHLIKDFVEQLTILKELIERQDRDGFKTLMSATAAYFRD